MLKKLKTILFLVGICSFILGVIVLFPGFDCRTITLSGQTIITHDRFDNAVSGLFQKNTVLLRLKPSFKEALKNQFNECAHMQFRLKSLHHLHVEIEEKKPWITCLVNHKTVVVSEDGSILSRDAVLSPEASTEMLVVRGLPTHYFEGYELDSVIMKSLRQLSEKINTYFPDKDLQLEYNDQVYWALLLNDTIPIYIGQETSLDSKFKLLDMFFNDSRSKDRIIKSIDSRVNNKVLVTYGTK